jgi:hypothetical protein
MQLTVLHWQYIFLNNSLTLSHSNLTFKACWEASKSRLHGSTFTQLSNHHCISTPGMYYSKTCIEQTFSQKYLPFTLSLPCAQLQSSWHLCLKVWNIGKHAMQIKHSYLPSSILSSNKIMTVHFSCQTWTASTHLKIWTKHSCSILY